MDKVINQTSFLQSFDKDKNILLKTAQDQIFTDLAQRLVSITIQKYSIHFNPLGLVDDTYQQILDYQFENIEELEGIYENLCVAYRYKYGDNQLEIIWDGKSHEEKYKEEWGETFDRWAHDLTENPSVIKGILQLTIFNESKRNLTFVRNAVKGLINEYFEIKILKRNGVKRVILKEKMLRKAS
ncbi:hypothetical protein N7E81_18050 [Reichenbachiella carrageenanivorans]|uniref:Uncharacterized protein n=1 Tax=Reichenbachiella carrageenanivorans TaxID=2979869 RepID=A0ABY6D0V8_9BACT|nr:hypothetical protein [Reichenbachiella carrageenanivorans]UXX79260.1 hypothetical protein N7E81_18050 [Reichenbachiella carrageenanivorans]